MPQLRTRIKRLFGSDDTSRQFTVRLYPPPSARLSNVKGEYVYDLEDCNIPPLQNDPVIRLIIKTIRELSKEDICVAAASVKVRNLTAGPTLWPPTLENLNCPVKLYTFKEHYEEFPMTVPVTIADRGGRLTANKTLVRIKGEWVLLESWLKELPSRHRLLGNRRNAILSQRFWWNRNGKVFRLMDLPAEIRLVLFEHIMGSKMYLDVRHDHLKQEDAITLSRPTSQPLGDHWFPGYARDFIRVFYEDTREIDVFGAFPPNYELLYVSKQVRAEALQAAWEGTRKHFMYSAHARDVLANPNPPSGYAWISRMELDFSITEYFEFFGVRVNPRVHVVDANSKGLLLKNLQGLKDLQLRFPHPSKGTNPWNDFNQLNRYHDWFRGDDTYQNMRENPCHKTVVDWILHFAFPFIKEIPTVRLAGFIKTSVKNKWSYILAAEYAQRKHGCRTHGYNRDADMDIITSTPVYWAPDCSCPFPCHYEAQLKVCAFLRYIHEDEFDYEDECTPELLDRVGKYNQVYGWRARTPRLFGPYADDLDKHEEQMKKKVAEDELLQKQTADRNRRGETSPEEDDKVEDEAAENIERVGDD